MLLRRDPSCRIQGQSFGRPLSFPSTARRAVNRGKWAVGRRFGGELRKARSQRRCSDSGFAHVPRWGLPTRARVPGAAPRAIRRTLARTRARLPAGNPPPGTSDSLSQKTSESGEIRAIPRTLEMIRDGGGPPDASSRGPLGARRGPRWKTRVSLPDAAATESPRRCARQPRCSAGSPAPPRRREKVARVQPPAVSGLGA